MAVVSPEGNRPKGEDMNDTLMLVFLLTNQYIPVVSMFNKLPNCRPTSKAGYHSKYFDTIPQDRFQNKTFLMSDILKAICCLLVI